MEHVRSLRVASTSVHELLRDIDWVIARKAKELVKYLNQRESCKIGHCLYVSYYVDNMELSDWRVCWCRY